MMASHTIRDLLIMAIRCFETKLNLEDSVVFDKVKHSLNGELLDVSNDKQLDLVTKNNTMLKEVEYLFNKNTKLSSEKDKLETLVRNLEGELSRSVNFSQIESRRSITLNDSNLNFGA
jgi:vacuolar-type H+-ATPase subunit I/STV1